MKKIITIEIYIDTDAMPREYMGIRSEFSGTGLQTVYEWDLIGHGGLDAPDWIPDCGCWKADNGKVYNNMRSRL